MLYTQTETDSLKNHIFAHLLIDEKDHPLTITLNHPKKKNAMNPIISANLPTH